MNSDVLQIQMSSKPTAFAFAKPFEIQGNLYRVRTWHWCRELWHTHFRKLPLCFFSHRGGKHRVIVEFIAKIEDKLNVHPRSQFGRTQKKNITWVKPSVWWIGPTMRRSLFTILLKVAQNYNLKNDNFEEALFSDEYTIDTRYAVNRFMDGYTKCLTSRRGWHKFFSTLSESQIDDLLKKE